MAAYILFIREGDVFNPDEMEEYVSRAGAIPRKFELKPLVIYGHMEAVEGQSPQGIVLLEFPTLEDAEAWYHSPEYQAAAEHRKKGADYRVIILQGL